MARIQSIRTVEERARFLEECDKEEQKLYRANGTSEESRANKTAHIQKLVTSAESLPVVALDVARNPTEETTEMLSRWFKEKLDTHVLIEYRVDPALIGGARVAFNGHFSEMSIARMLEEYFS